MRAKSWVEMEEEEAEKSELSATQEVILKGHDFFCNNVLKKTYILMG